MNALFGLEKCKEYMTISVAGKNYRIKLAGTIEQPYFHGKDVCDLLDHKDSKYALKTHVPTKYKKELSYFYQKDVDVGEGKPLPHLRIIDNHNILGKEKLMTYREGQTIYISEPGLYSLFEGSKLLKNKKELRYQIEKWILDTRYGPDNGLVDIFSFIKGYNLTFDITSDWFQDLWYPLSKTHTKQVYSRDNHNIENLESTTNMPPPCGGGI